MKTACPIYHRKLILQTGCPYCGIVLGANGDASYGARHFRDEGEDRGPLGNTTLEFQEFEGEGAGFASKTLFLNGRAPIQAECIPKAEYCIIS